MSARGNNGDRIEFDPGTREENRPMKQPASDPANGGSSLLQQGLEWLGLRTIPLKELRAKYETPASQYLEIDGTRIHYRMEGSGPPLVLLHGVLAHLQTWDGWVERLKDRYRIFRVDLPGFGLTGPMASGTLTPEYAMEMESRYVWPWARSVFTWPETRWAVSCPGTTPRTAPSASTG